MNLSLISERIRQQRKEKGLTQAGLAELLGMSEMTIRRWEAGKSSPRIDELKGLAKVFDTSLEYLIGQAEDTVQDTIAVYRENEVPSMSYWGGILDNAERAAKSGKNLGIILTILTNAAGTVKSAMV